MIRYFASHPTAANLLMIAMMLLGLVALPKLQRDTFPLIPATEVSLRISYPGSTPADVENVICQRIEEAMESVSGLKEIRCDARENLALLIAERYEETDMDTFFNDIKTRYDSISTFPDKVERAAIEIVERTATVASIMITGDIPPAQLKTYAEKVKTRIQRDSRIAQIEIKGFSNQDISIEISAYNLNSYGLGVMDIATVIENQSIDVPAGVMQTSDSDVLVRFSGERKSPDDFYNLTIHSGTTGGDIKLGDIAKIRKIFDKQEDKIFFNGKRAALLEISKTYSQDSLRVMGAIEENLKRERKLAPKGIKLEISQNVTSNIKDRLRILAENGLQGLLLVFLSMWVFFSFRYSFWVTMGLPVSFLGAIFCMQLLGYTINMMTMVALLVALGLLMDDAIVIAENIATRIKQEKNALEAAVEGTRQVLPGVLSSFLTTAMIVGPLAFLSGRMGAVLEYIPAVLLITLLISLIEAFLILPAHMYHSLKHADNSQPSRLHQRINTGFDYLRDQLFGRAINVAIKMPYLTLGLIIALMLCSFATIPSGLLKYRAFPQLESDIIQARILFPQGTPLKQTETIVEKIVIALKQTDKEFSDQQVSDHRLVNNITVLYNSNISAYESGPHVATVSADLISAEDRHGSIPEILSRWRELTGDHPDVIALKFTDKERGVAGKAIDIRLHGNQADILKKASLELQHWLRDFEGVLDLSDDFRPGKPEYQIQLREGANTLGVNAQSIASEVRAALHGVTQLDVIKGQNTYDVTVRLSPEDRNSLEDLKALTIRLPDGRRIALSNVADIQQVRGYARFHRVNGQRTVTVQGTLDTEIANAKEIMTTIKKQFLPKLKQKYPQLRFSFVGQGKQNALTAASLQRNVLIGLFGVFLILSFQFRSYLQPIAVMLAIPLGLIGVVWGHLLLGIELSMPSLVGLATLMGIIVNDSILLVTFIKNHWQTDMTISEAVKLAAHDRFRAIFLTSLTTIAGLLPLLLETSTQAQLLIPIVASLTFGLLTATVFSLFLIPCCFVIFEDLGWIEPVSTIENNVNNLNITK